MKRVLLGVSGGIAAYKIPELVRLLVKSGCSVKTILTDSAAHFCAKDAIAALSGDSVYTGVFEPVFLDEGHTELAKWPDVIVVAPATANTIAKLALGVADNLLTTTYLASAAPKLIVPSMNTRMYDADALQKNLSEMRAGGALTMPPDVGDLACRTYGVGRMPEPANIIEAAFRASGSRPLDGKRVIISAGASVESIDDVRTITNRSSGKMGAALARAAYRLGADVTLILGRAAVCPLPPVKIIPVESIRDFREAYAETQPYADYLIATAAIGDFVPAKKIKGKIRRGNLPLRLELSPSPDLIAEVARKKQHGQTIVGFALESELNERAARQKLREKKLDAIFLNSAAAMGADRNGGVALSAAGDRRVFRTVSKLDLAGQLWLWLISLN